MLAQWRAEGVRGGAFGCTQGETSGKVTTLPKRLRLMGGPSSSPWGG